MRLKRVSLFASVLLLAVRTNSQRTQPSIASPPAPTRDPQAAAMLNRAFGVIGGARITDVTLTGTAHRIEGGTDENGTAILKALATGEARIDLTFPSGQVSEVRANSARGPIGTWSGPDGISKTLALFNLLADSAWFSPALMLSKLALSTATIASASVPETHNGTSVEHVTVSEQFPKVPAQIASMMQHHSQMDIYLDASSLLPDTLTFNTHPDRDAGRDIPVEIRYSDYRLVEGVPMPFHVQRYLSGGLTLDLQFQAGELNTGLSSNSFSVPDQAIVVPVFNATH